MAGIMRLKDSVIDGQHMVLDRFLQKEVLQPSSFAGFLAARLFARLKSLRVS